MMRYPYPYLKGEVELTDEREHHIAERHPYLLSDYWQKEKSNGNEAELPV
jgi:hypothetical protein